MQDTAELLGQLDLSRTQSKLLAIIANTRGAEQAAQFNEIQYLGFPFSISENFQMRNTHKTIAESLVTLQEILDIAHTSEKEVVARKFFARLSKSSTPGSEDFKVFSFKERT